MPLFPVTCTKGHETEVLCSYTALPKQRCEVCGAAVEQDMRRHNIQTTRSFYGERESTSVVHGFHPSEVPLARKVMGPALRSDSQISDTGQVRFRNRQEETSFRRRMDSLRSRYDSSAGTVNRLNDIAKAKKAGTYTNPIAAIRKYVRRDAAQILRRAK